MTSHFDFGLQKEQELKPVLQDYFKTDLNLTDKYCRYDFENKDKTLLIELKSRRIKYNKYPTTVLCKSKLDFARTLPPDVDLYFFFCFTDGLYFIKYTDELLSYRLKTFRLQRGDIVQNIEININRLTKI